MKKKFNKKWVLIGAIIAVGAIVGYKTMNCSAKPIAVLDGDVLQTQATVYKNIIQEQKKHEEVWRIKFLAEKLVLEKEDKAIAEKKKIDNAAVMVLQKKVIALQQKYQQEGAKIIMATQTAVKQADTLTKEIVAEIAKEKGYLVVLTKQNTVYASECVDITEQVVKELNLKGTAIKYPNLETVDMTQKEKEK